MLCEHLFAIFIQIKSFKYLLFPHSYRRYMRDSSVCEVYYINRIDEFRIVTCPVPASYKLFVL